MNAPLTPARGLLLGYLALSPVIFWYNLLEPFEAVKAAFTQLTALALVVVAAAQGQSWADLRRLYGGPIGVAIACGVVSAVVSTVFSLSPRISLQGALDSNAGLGSVLALAVLFAASRATCGDAREAELLLRAAVVGAVLACAYALVQAVGHDPLRWSQAAEYRGWLRPSGTQGHPNYLGGYLVMVLPLMLWGLRRAVRQRQRDQVVIDGLLVMLVVAVVILSLSRGAWVAGAVAVALLLVRKPRTRLMAGMVAACGLGIVFVVDSPLLLAVRDRLTLASPGRWPIWQGAWQLFVNHPWTGCGLDTFGLAWPGVRTPEYWEVEWGFMPLRAHNDFLQALATQGLLGAIAFLMLPVALLWGLVRAWRRATARSLVLVLASMILAFYVQNLVGFAVASTSGLLAVVAGAVARLAEEDVHESTPAARVSFGLAVLPALGAAILAWFVLSPLWASSLSRRADVCLREDPSQAFAHHEQAVRLIPQSAHLHERHARALWHVATRDQMRHLLVASHVSSERACALEPRSASCHATRARILFDLACQGSVEKAEVFAAFDRALALDRCDWLVVADAARAASTLRDFDKCQQYLDAAPRLALLVAERGALEFARGEYARARAMLREALAGEWYGEEERYRRAAAVSDWVNERSGVPWP